MKLKLFLFAFVFLIGSAEQISAQKFLDKVLKGLEKTNQVLDEADKVLGTDESGSSSSQRSSRGKRVAGFKIVSPHPDLDIQFKRCAASASTVVIDLVMTWYGDDRKLTIGRNGVYSESTAFDDQGNQYDNGKNQNITANIANGEFSSEPRALFPSDVPLKVRIQITDVKRDANTFKRFILLVGGMNDPITFYNIPIERADEVTSVNSNQATPDKVLSDNSPLIAEQENTQELPKLKRIIGKWELVSLKKSGKEITFQPCTLQFYDKSNDDPYTKNMTETISGKARSTGYTVMPDNDNELIATLFITDDECDNSYTIQTVDSDKLILSFGYYGDPKIQGELVFKKVNV